MALIKCGKCQYEFEVGKPEIEIVNQLSFAAIIINFAGMPGMVCPNCKQKFVLAIQAVDIGAGLKIAHMPLPDQAQQPSIVAAPAGFNPRKIIQ